MVGKWNLSLFFALLIFLSFFSLSLPVCLSACLPILRSIINEAVKFYNNGHLSKIGHLKKKGEAQLEMTNECASTCSVCFVSDGCCYC